jgi:hypothetical protein
MLYSNLEKKQFSTYPPPTVSTLVTSLYQCLGVFFFYCCLSHFRIWSGIICDFQTSLREFLDPSVNRFARQTFPTVNRKRFFFVNILLPTKNAQQNAVSQARSSFWLLKPASEHARLLPRLSWSWTVLLPSDTYRKLITSITAVLLPFVTYLLIPSYFFLLFAYHSHSLSRESLSLVSDGYR